MPDHVWRTRPPLLRLALLGLSLAAPAFAHRQVGDIPYRFTTIDIPVEIRRGSTVTPDIVRFVDISNAGQLIGNDTGANGYLVTLPQVVTEILCPGDVTPNDATIAQAINASGTIVGQCSTPATPGSAFVRTPDGTVTLLTFPGAINTRGMGINDAGDIVGQYFTDDGTSSGWDAVHGFLWQGGVWTTIDAPFEGAAATLVTGINNAGQMIGTYLHATEGEIGFFVNPTAVTPWTILAMPDAVHAGCCGTTIPMDINNQGEVVGSTWDARGSASHFLYKEGVYSHITGGPLPTVPEAIPESVNNVVWGINDAGTLAGIFYQRVRICDTCSPDGTPFYLTESHGFIGTKVLHVSPAPVELVTRVDGDFNGDQNPDEAGLTREGAIWIGMAGAPWRQIPGALHTLLALDLDQDGRDDLAGLWGQYVFVWLASDEQWHHTGYLDTLVKGRWYEDGHAYLAGLFQGYVFRGQGLVTWHFANGWLQTLGTANVGDHDILLGWNGCWYYEVVNDHWTQGWCGTN